MTVSSSCADYRFVNSYKLYIAEVADKSGQHESLNCCIFKCEQNVDFVTRQMTNTGVNISNVKS